MKGISFSLASKLEGTVANWYVVVELQFYRIMRPSNQ